MGQALCPLLGQHIQEDRGVGIRRLEMKITSKIIPIHIQYKLHSESALSCSNNAVVCTPCTHNRLSYSGSPRSFARNAVLADTSDPFVSLAGAADTYWDLRKAVELAPRTGSDGRLCNSSSTRHLDMTHPCRGIARK